MALLWVYLLALWFDLHQIHLCDFQLKMIWGMSSELHLLVPKSVAELDWLRAFCLVNFPDWT